MFVGLAAALLLLVLAMAYALAFPSGFRDFVPPLDVRIVTWGWTAWMLESAFALLVVGNAELQVLQCLGFIAFVWLLDRLSQSNAWEQRVETWLNENPMRRCYLVGGLVAALPALVTTALRFGSDETQAVNTYVVDAFAFTPLSANGLVGVELVIVAGMAAVAQAVPTTLEVRRMILVGHVVPLSIWLVLPSFLPPQASDYGVWGVALCGFFAVASLWVPLVGARTPDERDALSG